MTKLEQGEKLEDEKVYWGKWKEYDTIYRVLDPSEDGSEK